MRKEGNIRIYNAVKQLTSRMEEWDWATMFRCHSPR